MPSMTTSNGMFLLEHTIDAVGDKNIQLNTQNTFVDQDILVKITTPAASNLSLDIEDKTTNVTIGTLNTTTNKYPVTATVAGTLTAANAGWFSSGSGYEDNVQVGLIPKAGFTVSEGVFSCNSPGYITSGDLTTITTVTPTASINTGTNNNYNGLTTYFTKLNNSTGANVTIIPQYSTSAGYVASATNSATTANTTYWKIITATPAFDGGVVSGTATASSSTATLSEDTNTSGISIITGGTATRTAVLYNGAVEGWVSKADNATALAAPSSATNLSQNTYYVNAVTLASGKTFSVTSAGTLNVSMSGGTTTITSTSTSAGTVTIKAKVANGDSSTTNQNVVSGGKWINTVVGSGSTTKSTTYGRTVVKYGAASANFTNANLSDYFDSGTSSSYSISITPRYTIGTDGYLAATTNQNGTTSYYTIKTTSISQGTTTVSDTTATRGTATWGTGWITSGTMNAATFANAATADTTYVDISGTTAAPVLISGDYLYINQGYVDNLKISLAKLVPDSATISVVSGESPHILSGYSAYDSTGALIAGTIPTKTSTNLTFDGATRTFTVPTGYYATNATKQIAACSITKGNGAVSLTSDTGSLSIYSSSNAHGIGIDDSAPASNSGKVYIKVTANGQVTTGVGWNNTSTTTTSNNKVRYISLNKYTGDYIIN